ncbi:MAG TPA: efflux RND transporter periplasmic adaptor subunit, partial [Gemmatimonadales bacterium]|nr:efflux RND transporter periplasmic adaptor subunit [Gemmatimonadales bacterium]
MTADRRLLLLAMVGCAACGRTVAKSEGSSAAAFGLTENQRARIHVAPVDVATFRPTVEVSGTVAFDGDHSTQVLAPISGPVTRVLVEPGAQVVAGQPLAYVSSPDFSAAVGA